jgi:hypothetical protein
MLMTTEIWNEAGDHPHESLNDKLNATGKLEGEEATAYVAGAFSNATHNNYSALQLFERVYVDFKITLEKKN